MRRKGSERPSKLSVARTRSRDSDRFVGWPDYSESRHPGTDVHLHIDGLGIDALKRKRRDV